MRRAKRTLLPALLVSFCLYQCLCDFGGGGNGCSLTCKTDEDCSAGRFCCTDGSCHECCADLHCPAGQHCCEEYYYTCNECCYSGDCPFPATCHDGERDFLCPVEGERCPPGDRYFCCPDLVCDLITGRCINPCLTDEECHDHPVRYAQDLQCTDGLCDFVHCEAESDCPPGKICHGGNCVTVDYSDITRCRLIPLSAIVSEGNTVLVRAAAYYSDDEAAPVSTFGWRSDDGNIASVDADGLVTGGTSPGGATITASPTGTVVFCHAAVANYTAATGTRVLVFDEFNGIPVEGATVVLGAEAPESTDADGEARFQADVSPAEPAAISVFHSDYNYVTLQGVESPDVVIHLEPVLNAQNTTSILGEFDLSEIYCDPYNFCSVGIGIAGLSIPGNLMNLDFSRAGLLPIIRLGHISGDVAYLNEYQQCHGNCIPRYYGVTGFAGERIAWGLAARVEDSDLIDRLGLAMAGNDEEIHRGALLTDMKSIYTRFHLSLVPDAWLVGEYNRQNMQPEVPAHKIATITPPALPVGVYDAVFVYAGAVVSGSGLVILGMGVGVDSLDANDVPDGLILNPIDVPVADTSGHVPDTYVRRVLIALATNVSNRDPPAAYAVQVLFPDAFEGTHALEDFMLPAEASYDPAARHLDVIQAPPADCYRATFRDDSNAGWHIFDTNAATFFLPAAPPEGDRAFKSAIYCIDLADGVAYQDLLEFNDTSLADLVELVQAFSCSEVP